MTEPISTRNLDRYGSAELPWSRPRDILANDTPEADLTFFVATVRPDGRPHSAGVGAAWVDGALYFTSGPGTLKSRNLAANPACSVSVCLRGIDLVLEGAAHRVTDSSTLERLAAVNHALSRLAAQHEEITRLRAAIAGTGNLRVLRPRADTDQPPRPTSGTPRV
jgi:hypothetical protein